MALSNTPTLLELIAELGLPLGSSLLDCINESGENFDKLLDFAGYSAVPSIDATYDFSNDIHSFIYEEYQRVDIIPAEREGCTINVNMYYYLHSGGNYINTPPFASVSYLIGNNVPEQPVWILIGFTNGDFYGDTVSGTAIINVPAGKNLFIRTIVREGDNNGEAVANLTLVNGNIEPPCEGTAVAIGSPLTWNRNS